MNIYVVRTISYDTGDLLKAFKEEEKAVEYRDSISHPIENGDDIVYELNSDSFWWVEINRVELV